MVFQILSHPPPSSIRILGWRVMISDTPLYSTYFSNSSMPLSSFIYFYLFESINKRCRIGISEIPRKRVMYNMTTLWLLSTK